MNTRLVGSYDVMNCPIPMVDIISFTHGYPKARAWSVFYANRMQTFVHLMSINTSHVDLGID